MKKLYAVLLIVTSFILFEYNSNLELFKENSKIEQVATVIKTTPVTWDNLGYISVEKDGKFYTLNQTRKTLHLLVGDQHDFKPEYTTLIGYNSSKENIFSEGINPKYGIFLFILSMIFSIFNLIIIGNFIHTVSQNYLAISNTD